MVGVASFLHSRPPPANPPLRKVPGLQAIPGTGVGIVGSGRALQAFTSCSNWFVCVEIFLMRQESSRTASDIWGSNGGNSPPCM